MLYGDNMTKNTILSSRKMVAWCIQPADMSFRYAVVKVSLRLMIVNGSEERISLNEWRTERRAWTARGAISPVRVFIDSNMYNFY